MTCTLWGVCLVATVWIVPLLHEVTFAYCVRRYRKEQRKSTKPVVLWVNLRFILLKFVLPELLYSLSYVGCVQSARYKFQISNSLFPHGGIGRGKIKHGCQCGIGNFRRGTIGTSSKGTHLHEANFFINLHGFCASSVVSFLSASTKLR
jgi:hypothetical protein